MDAQKLDTVTVQTCHGERDINVFAQVGAWAVTQTLYAGHSIRDTFTVTHIPSGRRFLGAIYHIDDAINLATKLDALAFDWWNYEYGAELPGKIETTTKRLWKKYLNYAAGQRLAAACEESEAPDAPEKP